METLTKSQITIRYEHCLNLINKLMNYLQDVKMETTEDYEKALREIEEDRKWKKQAWQEKMEEKGLRIPLPL